jgi:eukaryotic-like serine/threonine-protein kinase
MKYCSLCNQKFDDSISFCPADGEVLEEDPSALVGNVLDGQYQVEAVLGKGGMGAVYRARHILLGDRVAIKVLPPEMRSNTEWLRRFQREGQAARRFRHPNAVTVYDLRTSADGTIYLVMEYVEGSTLDVELRKHGRFSPAKALAVLDPIMSVLNAAHAMGVVHRDLKPENIMIGAASTGGEPTVKLLDLGIAKLREVAGAEKTGTTALTIAGQMLGTPYYMSPEQWGELPRDGNSDIDGRADIYSLGIVFYEIIAGKRPFGGMTLSELRREHVSVTPTPLHEVVDNVPAGFSEAIARAIAKDRGDRQATAGELENELMMALAAEGIKPSLTLTPGIPGTVTGSTGGRTSSKRSITAAERTAPTLVGEAPAITGIEGAESPQKNAANIPSQAATMPTVIASEKEITQSESSAISGQPGVVVSSQVAARRSPLLFVGLGVVALLLVVGIGGFAVVHLMKSGASTAGATKSGSSNGMTGSDLSAAPHEVGRYWLEVNSPNKSDSIRAGEVVAMQSGQQFKFHFSPSESGFLYIVGPNEKNTPTTFLTSKPIPGFGVTTNQVKSGLDFAFPADTSKDANWLNLDKTPGNDEFTMIFSSTPLSSPSYFAAPAGHELSQAEQNQLDEMRTRTRANSVATEVIKTGATPSVSVKIPQTEEGGAPVIFKVRIEHK